MRRRISPDTYRAIDLMIFAAILVIFENLIVRAARVWYADQIYTVSVAAAVCAIVMARWGAWGLLHAALAGLVFDLAGGGSPRQLAIYCVGNMLAAGALIFIRLAGHERIRGDSVTAVVYGILTQVLMQAGRAVTAIVMGEAPINCLGFFTTDSLSIVFTMVIIWIARRQDGLLEYQPDYLRRIHEEEEEEA